MKKAEIPEPLLYLAITLLESSLTPVSPTEADECVEVVVKALKPYLMEAK